MLPAESFGQRIRTRRTEMGLTQQQLADLMFVSRRTIINWESGNSLPDISMLARLASHLDLGTIELLDEMATPDNRPIIIAVESNEYILKAFIQLLIDKIHMQQIPAFPEGSKQFSRSRIAAGSGSLMSPLS